MNPTEQQLASALQSDPGNWDARLQWADLMIQRGGVNDSRNLITEATSPPATEAQMAKALSFFGGKPKGGNWGKILQAYLTHQRTDAKAHSAYAHMLAMVGSVDGAKQHYQIAISIDKSLVDASLADALGIPAEPETPAPVPAPEKTDPTPVAPKEAAIIEPTPLEADPQEQELEAKAEAKTESAPPNIQDPESHIPPESPGGSDDLEAPESSPEAKELVTVGGEAPKGAEKESDSKDKRTALIAAGVIHLALLILFAIWTVSQPPQAPPQIITKAPVADQEDKASVEKKKIRNEPSSIPDSMQVVTSNSASALALPDLTNPNEAFDVVGLDNGLGPSMDFGGGSKGGTVSFFGSRSSGSKVVFVIDASASMKIEGENGKTRFELMKEELKKSLKALPAGVAYQVIFFSGPAWFAGSPVDRENWKDRGGGNDWYYKAGNPEELPSNKLLRASPGRVQATIKDVDNTGMVYGTDWRSPLKMAMNLKPDLIFFMTDGAVKEPAGSTPVVEDVLSYNQGKSKAKINCICLMELKAFEMMKEIADGTGGDFSLVLENGDVLRGREVERIAAQNK